MNQHAPMLLPEIIVDAFAGGGGASEGIEQAMRRMEALGVLPTGVKPIVNIAINHDSKALAMHAANHRNTLHMKCDIWSADPLTVVKGNPVGLFWASPDCRDHSNAKGSAPISESVRALAWTVAHWAEQVSPRVIILENVTEFLKWGPLMMCPDGKMRRDPKRAGEYFKAWVKRFERMGYQVDWHISKAFTKGAPTIRKRLYVVMRNDGEPISFPHSSHGDPSKSGVKKGTLKPWHTAAEIIDWDRTCPSIFMDRDESKAFRKKTGIDTRRPLATNTERRIAKGIKREVIERAEAFIVTCNHSGEGFRGQGLDQPFATVTKARDGHGLVMPHLMTMRNSGKPHTSADRPTHTVTAGGAGLSLVNAAVAPFLSYGQQGGANRSIETPHQTVCASRKDTNSLVCAFIAQHNTGAISRAADNPLATIMGRGTTQQIVAANMISLKGGNGRGAYGCDTPHKTILAGGQHSAIVSLPLMAAYYSTGGQFYSLTEPNRTVTARDRFSLIDCKATVPPMSEAQAESARRVAWFLRKYDCWDGGEFVTVGPYVIIDIGLRMLTPRELARAQGFNDDYVLAAPWVNPETGKSQNLTETDQRHKIGNSVCPPEAKAHVLANYRPQLRAAPRPIQEWLLEVPA